MTLVSCLSLVSAVGYSPQAAAAALRAGFSTFDDLVYRSFSGSNVVGAMVGEVQPDTRGRDRLAGLAALAMDAIPEPYVNTLPWNEMPVFVCAPETDRPGPRLLDAVLDLPLSDQSSLSLRHARFVEAGSAAAFVAIQEAGELLADPRVPACLVLSIDSLIDARVLAWLEGRYRLKTADSPDGVIPGEAACVAVVSRQPVTPSAVGVLGLGFAHETATIMNDEPFLGHGLAAAVRAALYQAGVEMHEVDFRISDVAGESYAFEELVLAQTRVMRKVRPCDPLWHPADCIGDCGAAAGLIQLAWAEQAFARGYAPGPVGALHGSSTYGTRAAAIVTRPEASLR
jgi:3-oxoacyl-[acyl-carrier-protein] synthase-1